MDLKMKVKMDKHCIFFFKKNEFVGFLTNYDLVIKTPIRWVVKAGATCVI